MRSDSGLGRDPNSCYGLNYVMFSERYVEILTPDICECDLIWN